MMHQSPLRAGESLGELLLNGLTAHHSRIATTGRDDRPSGGHRKSLGAASRWVDPADMTAQSPARPPTTYQVTATAEAGGPAQVQAANETIPLDAGWATPPTGAPGPAELLASAFAACLIKNVARAGHLLDFRYADATATVVARRQDSPPKFVEISYTVELTTDESQHRIDLLHANLRKFGTVYNTLAAVCDVHGTVTARTAQS
jgi:uncharacterized OsmC-like protein